MLAERRSEIEEGYHFYNENEDEFESKGYDSAKIAAISYAAGKANGRRLEVKKVLLSGMGEWP